MKKIIIVLITLFVGLTNMAQEKNFDKVALKESFISQEGESLLFKQILERYEGKTIFIDIWASWCSDCVKSFPALKDLQKKEKDITYLMLSLDKEEESWKKGITKLGLKGEHYLFTSKWKTSGFCKSIALDWIPRYMIVDKKGEITMFKAITLDDSKILKAIHTKEKEDNSIKKL